LQEILEIADRSNKEVVAYLQWVLTLWRFVEYRDRRRVDREISFYGVKILSLSDTVGTSTPEVIPICFQI
jgi:hydroxymethylglutaryl-CoA lyase